MFNSLYNNIVRSTSYSSLFSLAYSKIKGVKAEIFFQRKAAYLIDEEFQNNEYDLINFPEKKFCVFRDRAGDCQWDTVTDRECSLTNPVKTKIIPQEDYENIITSLNEKEKMFSDKNSYNNLVKKVDYFFGNVIYKTPNSLQTVYTPVDDNDELDKIGQALMEIQDCFLMNKKVEKNNKTVSLEVISSWNKIEPNSLIFSDREYQLIKLKDGGFRFFRKLGSKEDWQSIEFLNEDLEELQDDKKCIVSKQTIDIPDIELQELTLSMKDKENYKKIHNKVNGILANLLYS